MDFLDVPGASGAHYRFRRVDRDGLPPGGGNLVAVGGAPPHRRLLLCGTARSLVRAAPALEAALANPAAAVFVRLNVARAAREAEHADIVAAVRPDADLPEIG